MPLLEKEACAFSVALKCRFKIEASIIESSLDLENVEWQRQKDAFHCIARAVICYQCNLIMMSMHVSNEDYHFKIIRNFILANNL